MISVNVFWETHANRSTTLSLIHILREKIGLAKNMLTYSGYSYIEIAAYLGFSSQSHLGKQFKKLTGFTLSEYRNTYGVRQFTS